MKASIIAAKNVLKEYWKDYKYLSKHPVNKAVQEVVNQIHEKGYAVLENYIPEEKCMLLRHEIDRILAEYSSFVWKDEQESDHRLFRAEQVSKPILDFFNDAYLKSIGESYLNYTLENYMTLAGYIKAMPYNIGSGSGWHRDSDFSKQFKAIAYLSNVSDEQGPFQIVPKSNRFIHVVKNINLSSNKSIKRFTEDEIRTSENHTTLTGHMGTVLLVDTLAIHRGSPILKEHRYALTNYYVGAHRYNEFMDCFQSIPHLK